MKATSSAKACLDTVSGVSSLIKELMYMLNKAGPNTEPYCTPWLVLIPPSISKEVVSKILATRVTISIGSSLAISSLIRVLRLTLSKASLRSIRHTNVLL